MPETVKEYGVPNRPDCDSCRTIFRDLAQAEAYAAAEDLDVIEEREVSVWRLRR